MTNDIKKLFNKPILLVTIVAVLVAGTLIAVSQLSSCSKVVKPPTSQAPTPSPPTGPPTEIPEQPTKGSPDAPVTIIEFSSFYCVWCARFASETAPQIEEEYIQPGLVKLVFRNFTGGQAGLLAAEAGECAHEQGRFWEYHDRLFTEIFEERRGLGEEELRGLAAELDLDVEAFARCLEDDRYLENVQADIDEGQRLGVTGTPTFFINGRKVVGAQPFEKFKQIIEEELAKQRK